MSYFSKVANSRDSKVNALLSNNGYGGQLVDTAGAARTIYYTFDPAASGYNSLRPGAGAVAMNAAQKAMVKSVLAKLSAIADVKFVMGTRWVSPLNNAPDEYGYRDSSKTTPQIDLSFHLYKNGYGTGEALPDLTSSVGGKFIGGRVTVKQSAVGSDGTFLLLHETGHALGLKHPGNYSGGYGTGPYLPTSLDNTSNTVMSYNGETSNVTNYQSLDRAALSYIYGRAGSDKRVISGKKVTDTDYDDKYNGKTRTTGVVYNGKGGHDLAYGSNLADTMVGGKGDDRLFGLNGNDLLRGDAGYDWLDGGNGNDRLQGDSLATGDVMKGGAGNDTITGGAGHDSIEGGADNDYIASGAGKDRIWGGTGNDTIFSDGASGTDADTIYGGTGADTIASYGGADLIFGGDDSIGSGDGADYIVSGDGADTVYAGAGDDTVLGGDGADSLYGGADNDVVDGGAGNDSIDGGDGNDSLIGGTGSDTLSGGAGDDTLVGGLYDAALVGGTGDDTFMFDVAALVAEGAYSPSFIISDFEGAGVSGGDVLTLRNFTGLTDSGSTPITSAADLAAAGTVSGSDMIYTVYANGISVTITVVGGASMNAGDLALA